MAKIDPYKLREDFPIYTNTPTIDGKHLSYLDNAATSFKPLSVIQAQDYYYLYETANAHRGDYKLAHDVDVLYEKARETVAKFINANKNEIAFTSGTSMSLNMVAFGFENLLEEGDEILLSEAEHASNVLPWFSIAKRKNLVVKYVPLTKEGRLTVENFEKSLTPKTKVVSLAMVTNVLGYQVDIKTLCKIAHEHDCYFVCDGAQSVPHQKTDVKDLDVDFLAFSGHKMLGPTGIGVLYGKFDLLKKLDPLLSGGGMSTRFDTCGDITYQLPPYKFEAGTQNIAGALGLAAACDYLSAIGMDEIEAYERDLRKYCIQKLDELDNIVIYNHDADNGIITFNVKGVNSQDASTLLASKGVCVRSGQHCAKILLDFLHTDSTIRASFYFYNTKEDVDQFVEAVKQGGNFLDAYFLWSKYVKRNYHG